MGAIKTIVVKVKNNKTGSLIGLAVGLYGGHVLAKKTESKGKKVLCYVGLALAGVIVGSQIQSAITAKQSMPTKAAATATPAPTK